MIACQASTFYFLGELHPLRIGERTTLIIYVTDIKHFTHKLNHRLSFVEGRGRNWKRTKHTIYKVRAGPHRHLAGSAYGHLPETTFPGFVFF